MKKQSKVLASQEFAVFCFTLAVVLAFVLLSSSFATVANFRLILSQVSINGICAIGVSMVVFLGGIDLSSGAILALCTSCSGMFVNMGIPVFFCILMSMAIGVLCGLFNGALVARLRIPPIIATMASMNIFRGIATGSQAFQNTSIHWAKAESVVFRSHFGYLQSSQPPAVF